LEADNMSLHVTSSILVLIAAIVLLPSLFGGLFIILVVANRAEPDPTGRRPVVVYRLAMSFVTLFVTVVGTAVAVDSLCSLIGTRTGTGDALHPVGDEVARTVVLGLIVAAVAGGIFAVHVRGASRMGGNEEVGTGRPVGPVGRVWQSYVGATDFLYVILVIAFTVLGVYQVFRIISPAVFNFGAGAMNRVAPVRILLPSLYVVAISAGVIAGHRRRVTKASASGATGVSGAGLGDVGPAPAAPGAPAG
jgi:hypothetical protein